MGIKEFARWVTGKEAPLPIVTEVEEERGWMEWRLPGAEAMCDEASVSRNQSDVPVPAGRTPVFARAASSALGSWVGDTPG